MQMFYGNNIICWSLSIYAFNQNVFFILTKTRQCNVAVTNINADFDAIKIGPWKHQNGEINGHYR